MAASDIIKRAGKSAGHSKAALSRAVDRLKISIISSGYPRRTYWRLSLSLSLKQLQQLR